jgi:hypothetical protein
MMKKKDNKAKKPAVKLKSDIAHVKAENDGMNTPVPDASSKHVPSASEAALIKQAENPLGNPNRQ